MGWIVLALLLLVVLLLSTARQLPWARRLRRWRQEWAAPDEIVHEVRRDYMAAMRWLQESVLGEWAHQWASAPLFLAGAYLQRYQAILLGYRAHGVPRCIGVLHAEHLMSIRHFSGDGVRCLVIDHQSHCLMVTYDPRTMARLSSQSLPDSASVYQMVYDTHAQRWKIERYVQQLPAGWSLRMTLSTGLLHAAGRDN